MARGLVGVVLLVSLQSCAAESGSPHPTVTFEGTTYALGDAVIVTDTAGIRILTVMNMEDTCAAMMDEAEAVPLPNQERVLVVQDWDVPADVTLAPPAVDARLYDFDDAGAPVVIYGSGTNAGDSMRLSTVSAGIEEVELHLTFEVKSVDDALLPLDPPASLDATFTTVPCPH